MPFESSLTFSKLIKEGQTTTLTEGIGSAIFLEMPHINSSASEIVLFIFQFPAMRNSRIFIFLYCYFFFEIKFYF